MFYAAAKVIYRTEEGGFFGPGIAELLELIDECGSIKDACRAMGMSYSKGRSIVSRAEERLGFPLIEKQRGGASGGTSALTEEGKRFTEQYRVFEADVKAYAKKHFEEMAAMNQTGAE